ncbi:MAG: VOC family protein, partial [Actinomycetota bacterium]|nr:VOC family protein [Actinomycetota bacterium]
MPEITKHVETMFSYADLSTTDLEAAKAFYTGLFGWNLEDVPMGEDGGTYTMFNKNGKITAAASLQQEQQREAGVPPMWNVYFTVYDLDARTKEAERAGGSIHAGPFDVFDAGRMGVIADPTGGVLCVWQ